MLIRYFYADFLLNIFFAQLFVSTFFFSSITLLAAGAVAVFLASSVVSVGLYAGAAS